MISLISRSPSALGHTRIFALVYKQTDADFARSDVEFLVLLEGMDDTHSTIVNTRSSYKASEIEWGRKFSPVLDEMPDGSISIDMLKISETESAALPE